MNLSNIKRIALIPNFNPKKGYPEFGTHTVKVVKPKIVQALEAVIADTNVLPKWKKNKIKRLKKAKKAFNQKVGVGYKPTLLVSTKLV